MHFRNGVDIELHGNVESWTEECPHGYVVECERDHTPGFRMTDMCTDCPICRELIYNGRWH